MKVNIIIELEVHDDSFDPSDRFYENLYDVVNDLQYNDIDFKIERINIEEGV